MKAQNIVMESESRHGFEWVKRVALSAPGKCLLAVALIPGMVIIPLLTRADQTNEQRKLTGNWMVTVTRVNPAPGQAPAFLSLVTYFEDGNLLQEGSDTAIRGTGRGNWGRIRHQQFTQSFVFFRFDAARTYLGTRVVTSTITLSRDGNEYQADSTGQNFDTSGNLLTTSQATEVGQRL